MSGGSRDAQTDPGWRAHTLGLYTFGFGVFTVASSLCGFSQSGSQLLFFRVLQGIGAALLFANSTALVTDAFPQLPARLRARHQLDGRGERVHSGNRPRGHHHRVSRLALRLLHQHPVRPVRHPWAFLQLHEIVEPERKARFDVGGMLAFPLGIGSLLAGLTFIVLGRLGEPTTAVLFVAGLVILALFFWIEQRVAHPMLDLSLFRVRVFLAGNISLLLNALARGSTTCIMSWYFQSVLQDSPLMAGLKLSR